MQSTIKYALYLDGWSYLLGSKVELRQLAAKVPATEYLTTMKGQIFCPECSAPLFRSPENKAFAKDGTPAYFAHSRSVQTECSLRVKRAEGKRYLNEEEAKQAIENKSLVVVSSFLREKPKLPNLDGPSVYSEEPNEDLDGPMTEQAIGRHSGDTFSLPSRMTTIRGICRRLDVNLKKYYILPGEVVAKSLRDLILSVSEITDICSVPRLYIGRISHFYYRSSLPHHQRATFFSYKSNVKHKDLCIKTSHEMSHDQGIDDDSIGRLVIFYGSIVKSGIGLAADVAWGEFSLVPEQYEYLFYDI